ncbi:TKL protein kinase [Phytophthora palmivora]|uniref:TKL protein kinase n=1 Tax=Phytophthora palmivora TaxID=4796 RepID=A0A2P4Y4X7_9STRA|nr:TKL protein kinase [Phytophthora palmivora]
MDAKLTDFGISKERLNQSMTAGVGTTLWMAPKVMLGENYDTKADMFAFGVVLSELDVHSLPYSHVKQRGLDSDGQEMLEAVLLRKITATEVEFSESSPLSGVELGLDCVAIDPNERPSAAEALYRLQQISSHDLA